MKKVLMAASVLFVTLQLAAQQPAADSGVIGKITVVKDTRLNELARKELAFNEAMALAPHSGAGYRLILLSSNDQARVMQVRSQLLQRYPDQKAYIIYQSPYIKLKFGNFLTKPEADNMRKEILKSKIITGNIYITGETIEIKPEKKEPIDTE